jgi:hypothetical protein
MFRTKNDENILQLSQDRGVGDPWVYMPGRNSYIARYVYSDLAMT